VKALVVPLCSTTVSEEELLRCVNSVVDQEYHPFDWDLKVVCNTNDDDYYNGIKGAVKNFEVVKTKSNGGNGMGHNSVLDLYKSMYKKENYTHLIMIDGDDFYYPCAFESIGDLNQIVDFDYLSNMQITDSVRCHETQQPHKEVIPGAWLHSYFNFRSPIPSYTYWDGHNCTGGEVTLAISSRAVECDLKHLEVPNIPDDFTHMLWALKAHVEGKLLFVNTDCNDVYVYDKTNPIGTTNQPEFVFSPDQWPEAERQLLRGNTFNCLRDFNRQQLPWVTIPQIMSPDEKVDFVRSKLINKGQFADWQA